MMARCSTLALTVALFGLALTGAIQGQGREGGQGRQGGRGQQAVVLPDGPGKEAVQARCVACHNLNLVIGSTGYTHDRWQDLIDTMIKLPDDQRNSVTQYLAAHFPPKGGREPVIVPGPVSITFKEWIAPTLGQRSRDPYQLADGTIYWVGQYASVIGRLNPKTGEMKEWKLDPASRPHSIVGDPAGNVWYTGNANGTIGRLNPTTGEITVFKLPDPAARDPHTPIFAKDGVTLWFTLQQSNMIGRLDTRTGEFKLVTVPTPRALPYGIKINSKGVPWVSYNGSNKLAELDPVTMAIREHVLPRPETTVRRLALTSDDMVWYVNSSLGALGRLNPATGEIKEWPSPSGPNTHPYAIAVVDDVVWYNESLRRPDALVRFDPKTEKFQSWAIPSGYGIIRHMSATPDGNLVIHQSSSNRIGLVTIQKPSTTTSSN
jgi:virginiamycin B lyase